jgi:hypothetical protein
MMAHILAFCNKIREGTEGKESDNPQGREQEGRKAVAHILAFCNKIREGTGGKETCLQKQ